MQMFAVNIPSKSPQQHTARQGTPNFAVDSEWAAGWSDFSPAATAGCDHAARGAQNIQTTATKASHVAGFLPIT